MKISVEDYDDGEFKPKLKVGLNEPSKSKSPSPASKEESKGEDFNPLFNDTWECFTQFPSSFHLMAVVDPIIREQRVILHPWQVEESLTICSKKPTNRHPYKYALCAANGSGKDAFVIAPFVLWFLTCKVRALCVITSSSGTQLSNQTENYIRSLGNKINAWTTEVMGKPILKINQRHVQCLMSGSEAFLFATDEEGKAEGYHPKDPDAEMAIIVNEAKSVKPEIFRALRRCTGYNYWLNVSTPGEPRGDFYQSYKNWPNRRRITYYDCPHQSPVEFEEDKIQLGEHSPLFRSKWLALFTYTEGRYVVNQMSMEKLLDKQEKNLVNRTKLDSVKRVGLDIALSANGDETVTTMFIGNEQTQLLTYRIQDATKLASAIENDWREKFGLRTSNNAGHIINADDGGVGRAVIDILRSRGWNINRVLNNSAAVSKKTYRNKGAEIWYKFSRLIEEAAIILLPDKKLHEQICSRKYKESTAGIDKLTLQSKKEMMAEGLPSPDRADATVLAAKAFNLHQLLEKKDIIDDSEKVKRGQPIEIIEQRLLDGEFDDELNPRNKNNKHSNFSLRKIFKNRENSNPLKHILRR